MDCAHHHLCNKVIENSKIVKSYSQAERADTITVMVEGRGPGFTFKYEYDDQNRLQAIVSSDGLKSQFEYDQQGKLLRASFSYGRANAL